MYLCTKLPMFQCTKLPMYQPGSRFRRDSGVHSHWSTQFLFNFCRHDLLRQTLHGQPLQWFNLIRQFMWPDMAPIQLTWTITLLHHFYQTFQTQPKSIVLFFKTFNLFQRRKAKRKALKKKKKKKRKHWTAHKTTNQN